MRRALRRRRARAQARWAALTRVGGMVLVPGARLPGLEVLLSGRVSMVVDVLDVRVRDDRIVLAIREAGESMLYDCTSPAVRRWAATVTEHDLLPCAALVARTETGGLTVRGLY